VAKLDGVSVTAPNFSARSLGDGTIALDIFDGIGGGDGIAVSHVAKALEGSASRPVRLRINSPGGDAFSGAAIYNLLKGHPGGVTVDVLGLAASAASLIAMAGAPVRMAENALMMIHDPWTIVMGNADRLRAVLEQLDRDADSLARTYAKKTGKGTEEIRELMRAETWMTAEEAIAAGFADESMDAVPVAASLRPESLAAFAKIPEAAMRFVRSAQATEQSKPVPIVAMPAQEHGAFSMRAFMRNCR
jgi:ATP-dependent protease ClpP protease subunit